MTVGAFEAVELVLNNAYSVYYRRHMAGLTGNLRVAAFQFEIGLIMIELTDVPGIKAMTPGAIRNAIAGELIVMHILMTTDTIGCRILESGVRVGIGVFFRAMASHTALGGMSTP